MKRIFLQRCAPLVAWIVIILVVATLFHQRVNYLLGELLIIVIFSLAAVFLTSWRSALYAALFTGITLAALSIPLPHVGIILAPIGRLAMVLGAWGAMLVTATIVIGYLTLEKEPPPATPPEASSS